MRMDENLAAVTTAIGNPSRLGVAFSGGVDSAVVLAVAVAKLGAERVLAILAISPSLPNHERVAAKNLAAKLGVELVELATSELENPQYQANWADRCYHCKSELFEQIDDEIARQYGLAAIACGENADDARRADRPGAQAGREHGVLAPLAAAGLGKAQVRDLARHLGLSVADKPAAPCLASRIPFGEPVTAAKLVQIDQAEAVLRDLGFRDSRVRHHGAIARIEVPKSEMAKLLEAAEVVQQKIQELGFTHVTLDLGGLQSGRFARLTLERNRD